MNWKRIGTIAVGVALAIVVVGGGAFWLWRPWVPKMVMSDPAPTGRRINDGGLLANYFPGVGAGRRPAILLLGGSEGGLGTASTRIARALQQQGFSVLHISYFRGPGQARTLENVPLETFDRGLDWLRRQPDVDATRLGIVGASKGAEAALIVATRQPGLKAIVAGMPSSVVWNGIDWEWTLFGAGDEPSWSANGKPLPALAYGKFVPEEYAKSVYENGLKLLPRHPETIIPVERARAAILLVCGEKDQLWPSCTMSRQVVARAKARGGPPVELLAYKDAGHGVFGLPAARNDPRYAGLGILGGSMAGNAEARADGWPRTLAFLKQRLG